MFLPRSLVYEARADADLKYRSRRDAGRLVNRQSKGTLRLHPSSRYQRRGFGHPITSSFQADTRPQLSSARVYCPDFVWSLRMKQMKQLPNDGSCSSLELTQAAGAI